MERIFTAAAELVGNTPLVEVKKYAEKFGLRSRLLVKLEGMNPAGSVKDRVALEMIRDAEEKGQLRHGSVIIEPTSGNTGIGLAAMAAARGYRTVIVMPDTMSVERRLLMKAFGAELVLTEGAKGMQGAIEKAEELAKNTPGSFIPGQFSNPANPAAHYKTTGPEIWRDTDGRVDILVAGVGTGGTISGTGRYLKEQNPSVRIVAVEPAASPMLTRGVSGKHDLQGIGANFVPDNLDRALLDEIVPIREKDAYEAARILGRLEGIVAGISSGAALAAATELAKKETGKTVVCILPDTGDRYLSTALFAE